MNILSIGNSFSQDATRYFSQIAAAGGETIKVVNLFNGGCSLERHIQHLVDETPAYLYELCGKSTGRMVTIQEAVAEGGWDIVTMQQVSRLSIDYSTYQPYLGLLAAYVKKHAPDAVQILHQTWGYEPESEKLAICGFKTNRKMFETVKAAYAEAAEEMGIETLIPSGEAMALACEAGLSPLFRDDVHVSLGLGRYILGGVWYETLLGKDFRDNPFSETDEPIEKAIREKAMEIVHTSTRAYK